MTPRSQLLQRLAIAAPRAATDSVLLHQAAADRLGLHVTDLRSLQRLAERGSATAGELAAATGLTTGAVTRMIDRLERAGYVRREHDDADRRRVLVWPVEERLTTLGQLYASLAADWDALLERYSDEDLASFSDLFDRMHELSLRQIAALRDLPAGADPTRKDHHA